jgi:hypothetical protein
MLMGDNHIWCYLSRLTESIFSCHMHWTYKVFNNSGRNRVKPSCRFVV